MRQRLRDRLPGQRGFHAAMVFTLAVLVYLPTLRNGFAYDDVPIIALDDRVHDMDVQQIVTSGYWRDTTSALYRPLTTLSYALDWQVSDGSPTWFHLTNAIWHGIVTVLLLLLLHALGAPAALALLGAAIFAVHPVHVEAVANTVGRAELIAAAFCLASALLWTRPMRVARRPRDLFLLALLFALALLSKESAIVLPGLLVVVDIVRRRLRPGRVRAWLRARLLPLSVCAAVIVSFFALRSLLPGAVTPDNLDPSLEVLANPAHRVMTALQAWPHYARLLFYPRVLLADYGPRIIMPAVTLQSDVLLGMTLFAASVFGGLLAWERRRAFTAGALLWFAVAIFPVSNLLIPIGVLVAERTLYLPSVALSFGIVAAVGAAARRWPDPRARALFIGVAGVTLGLLTARSVVRMPDWKSTNSIFAALLRDRPDSFRGTWHFARLDAAHADHAAAAQRYAEALDLWPYRKRLVRDAALHANRTGDLERAEALIAFSLRRWPDDLTLRRVQAGILLDRGEYVAARYHIVEGLRSHPQDSLLLRMMDAASAGLRSSSRP